MDIVAHGLWVGIGLTALARRRPVSRRRPLDSRACRAARSRAIAARGRLGGEPVRWLGNPQSLCNGLAWLRARPSAAGGLVDPSPALRVSQLVAAAVTGMVWLATRSVWLPLFGWWAHIVIDVFTHSAEFYPSPVLYPITRQGFDGIAWNTPWFAVANYTAIGAAMLALFLTRRSTLRA